jgi:hypothetical protein
MSIKRNFSAKRFIVVLLALLPLVTLAQSKMKPATAPEVVNKINDYNAAWPGEKLHFQLDKPYYAIGDTLWFKGYLLNSALSYSPLSTRMYVDLLNDSAKIVKRFAVPVAYGVTWGNISLDSLYLHEGVYTIRAYTNWMRNFNDESTFYHSFYLSKPTSSPYIIQANTAIEQVAGKDNAGVKLKFNTLGGLPVVAQAFQLKAINGHKVIYRGIGTTSVEGTLNANIPLPDQTKLNNFTLIAQPKNSPPKTTAIPLPVNRSSDIDIQFMPESGVLVTGLPSSVGFKAIGQDGLGVDIKGSVYDKENNKIAQLSVPYKGIGKFDLVPQDGEAYTVKVTLPDGAAKTIELPKAKASGTVLRVHKNPESDTLMVSIYVSGDLLNTPNSYYLIAQSRGAICYAAGLVINRPLTHLYIPGNLFPTGVAHFTLLNTNQLPVNERLAFIDHQNMLKIGIQPGRQTYGSRDSVALHIKVHDHTGKGVVGSFSLAVTDDAQLKNNPQQSNILSDLLLKPDMHGYIEDPGFYFQDAVAMDALMLTQGWTGFNWKDITAANTPKPQYLPELEYTVTGELANLLNKPIAKAHVTLLAKGRASFAMDTLTNNSGAFLFHKFPPLDTVVFILQANHANGRAVNAGISVDNLDSPPVVSMPKAAIKPWYVNTDSTALNFARTSDKYHQALDKAYYGVSGRMLRSVDIKAHAVVKGSNNLNGAGNADQVVTTAEVDNAGKVTLLELIEQKIANFSSDYINRGTELTFLIKDKKVRFVIDGIDMDRFYEPVSGQITDRYDYLKQTLDYLTAEDILGIEVMSSSRYTDKYESQYSTDLLLNELRGNPLGPRGSDYAFLEITTRSGQGPNMRRANNIYVYKPLPTTAPAIFYSPRYTVKDVNNKLPDLRSTIYWSPNVITDKNGEATVKFYTADHISTYSIILEGVDLNGKIGYQRGTMKVGHAN